MKFSAPDGTLVGYEKGPGGNFWSIDLANGTRSLLGMGSGLGSFQAFEYAPDGTLVGYEKARVAPISGSVIGGMLTSKCAITQVANRTYILTGSLFAFSGHRNLSLICQKRVG